MTILGIIKVGIRRKELARIYNVDVRIITQWLEDIEINHSRTLSPKELVRFLEHYGIPNERVKVDIPIQMNLQLSA